MFWIITLSIDELAIGGTPPHEDLVLHFRGFDRSDAVEGHVPNYVEYEMGDDRWNELQSQVEKDDRGNSHMLMLNTYTRMLAEYPRIMDGRKRGFDRRFYFGRWRICARSAS